MSSRPSNVAPLCAECGASIIGEIGSPSGWTLYGCPRGSLDDDEQRWPCRIEPAVRDANVTHQGRNTA